MLQSAAPSVSAFATEANPGGVQAVSAVQTYLSEPVNTRFSGTGAASMGLFVLGTPNGTLSLEGTFDSDTAIKKGTARWFKISHTSAPFATQAGAPPTFAAGDLTIAGAAFAGSYAWASSGAFRAVRVRYVHASSSGSIEVLVYKTPTQ